MWLLVLITAGGNVHVIFRRSAHRSLKLPAELWCRRQVSSRRNPNTWYHSTAPNKARKISDRRNAKVLKSTIRWEIIKYYVHLTLDFSMHNSSIFIKSELKSRKNKQVLNLEFHANILCNLVKHFDKIKKSHCFNRKSRRTFQWHQRYTGWPPEPVLLVHRVWI